MRVLRYFLVGFGSLIFGSAQAYQWEAGGNVGVSWLDTSDTNSFAVTEIETDSLDPSDNDKAIYLRAGLGYNWYEKLPPNSDCILWWNRFQTAINVFGFSENLTGQVFQFQQSDLNNYTYRIPMTTFGAMLDGKFSLFTWHKTSPYLLAGIGLTRNKFDYEETALPGIDPTTAYNLEGSSVNKFGYELGAGVQYQVGPQFALSLDYLYTYIGNFSTTTQTALPLIDPIRFKLTTNTVMVGAQWRFDMNKNQSRDERLPIPNEDI